MYSARPAARARSRGARGNGRRGTCPLPGWTPRDCIRGWSARRAFPRRSRGPTRRSGRRPRSCRSQSSRRRPRRARLDQDRGRTARCCTPRRGRSGTPPPRLRSAACVLRGRERGRSPPMRPGGWRSANVQVVVGREGHEPVGSSRPIRAAAATRARRGHDNSFNPRRTYFCEPLLALPLRPGQDPAVGAGRLVQYRQVFE